MEGAQEIEEAHEERLRERTMRLGVDDLTKNEELKVLQNPMAPNP